MVTLGFDPDRKRFVGGKTSKYQDVITVRDADHRTLTSRVQGVDGTWTEFMTARYRRRK